MNRQKLLLFVLLIMFALSLGYGYFRMPRQKIADKARSVQESGTRPKPGDNVKVNDKKLKLELLDQGVVRFAGFRRNIFRPIFHEELKAISLPPPPPPPKPPIKPPASQSSGKAAEPAVPPTPETPAYVKDMATFTFLGFVKKDNRKTLFLSKSNEIFLVKKGDRIADKYEVTNITDEVLTINVIAEGREIIIPLEENKALTPARK